jgi:hypothetical protein
MVLNALLFFILIGFGSDIVVAANVKYSSPEYCSIYNDLMDYEKQADLDDAVENDEQAGYSTCVGGYKQSFKYNDLLNYTREIQKEIVDGGSKKFRAELKNELVRESFKKMQSYTLIPGVKLNQSSVNRVKSCLGKEVDWSSDKKDLRLSYEAFSFNSFKDTLKVKAYKDQLEKLEKAFEPIMLEYRRYDTLTKSRERDQKHKGRSKGIRIKHKSLRDPEVEKVYAGIKAEYEQQRNGMNSKIYQIASTNPVLFDISRDWSYKKFLEKEIELSDIGKTYMNGIPSNIKETMKHLNSENVNTIYNSYDDDIQKHVSKLIKNKTLKKDTQKALSEFVDDGMDEVVELCHGEGERLHNFPLLVEKVLKDKGRDPNTTENDIMSMQASYCYLLKEEPISQDGFLSERASNWGLGAGLVGTGLLFTPFAPVGAWILGGATTAFVADTTVVAYKELKLSGENQLANSVGWNDLSSYIENDEAFWKTVSFEALLSATWLKYPGVHLRQFIKKGRDAKKAADKNVKALEQDSPGKMFDDLEESHKGKGNSQIEEHKNSDVLRKLDKLRERNEAYAYSTMYKESGMEKRLDDIIKESGDSLKKSIVEAREDMLNLTDDISDNQTSLAEALIAQNTLTRLTNVKIKNISPEKPLTLDLPILKDGKIIKNSGKNKKTFNTQAEYDRYIASLKDEVDDNLFKHLLSKEDLSEGFKKTLKDLDTYKSYKKNLADMVNEGKEEYARMKFVKKQVGTKIPSESNPITVAVPYIKDGKLIYPKVGGKRDVTFWNENELKAYLKKKQEIVDKVYATTKSQAFNKESGLTKRMLRQAELRKELGFIRAKLSQIPEAERSYKQQKLYLDILKTYDDPKLFPRTKENNLLNTLELRAERKELSRRYVSFLTLKQFGRSKDDPISTVKRYTGQMTYIAAIGGIGSFAYNEVTFDIEDALKSGDIGKVRAHFIEKMDIKRRTLFGASDEELLCASQIRGFVFDNMCLLPLLEEYLIVEYTKRKNDPSFDIATDKVAIRKTIDYMKYMLDLRNLRGDGAVSQLHDRYRFKATNLTGAAVLVKALDLVDNVKKEDVSKAYRIITTTKDAKREELLIDLSTSDPELAGAVRLALQVGLEDSIVAYGELPIEVKEHLNTLITNAKSESEELALIEAREISHLLTTD